MNVNDISEIQNSLVYCDDLINSKDAQRIEGQQFEMSTNNEGEITQNIDIEEDSFYREQGNLEDDQDSKEGAQITDKQGQLNNFPQENVRVEKRLVSCLKIRQIENIMPTVDKKGILEYVQNVEGYDAYAWPSSIEQGMLHNQACSLGKRSVSSQICKCCGQRKAEKEYNWFKVDVTQELSATYGTAVPLFFEICKYYAICILVVFSINGFYTLYSYQYVCKKFPDLCYNMLGFMPIVGNIDMHDHLSPDSSSFLKWLDFLSYIAVLLSQILVDMFIDYRERHLRESSDKQSTTARSLLISGIPSKSTQKQIQIFLKETYSKFSERTDTIKEKEGHKSSFDNHLIHNELEIEEFFFIKDYSTYYEVFEKKTRLSFQCKPLRNAIELNEKQKKRAAKIFLEEESVNKEWENLSQTECKFKGKAVITLKTYAQAAQLRKMLPKSSLRIFRVVWMNLMKRIDYFKDSKVPESENLHCRIMMQWAPEAKEIYWQNIGIKNSQKTKLIMYTFVLSLVAGIISGLSLVFLSKIIQPVYILIFNIFFMILFIIFLNYLAEKKRGKTSTSKAYFIMSKQGFFSLIQFVVLPVLFYAFSQSESASNRKYSLFILFIFNSGFQFFFIALNSKHRVHQKFLEKALKPDSDIGQKHCQKVLNSKMEKPEFELEQRMIGVMQFWTFSTIHAFLCSYTLIFAVIFLCLIYLLSKRMLFTQYSLYNYKNLSLHRRFLRTYSLIFQFAVLFVFLISDHTQLQDILAAVSFALFYIGYYTYQYFIKRKLLAKALSQNRIRHSQSLFLDSYFLSYTRFLHQYNQPHLLHFSEHED